MSAHTLDEQNDGSAIFNSEDDDLDSEKGKKASTDKDGGSGQDDDKRAKKESPAGDDLDSGDQGHGDADSSDTDAQGADSGDGKTEEEREAIRERRRQERKQKRERDKRNREFMERQLAARDSELAELRQTVGQLQRNSSGTELASIEASIEQLSEAYHYNKELIATATEAKDGRTVAEATEKMVQARERLRELDNLRKAHLDASRRQPKPQQRQINPDVRVHADRFMAKYKWYDPRAQNPESRIVFVLDQELSREGFDPASTEYWEELEDRMKENLPKHLTSGYNSGGNGSKGGDQQRQGRRPTVTGGGDNGNSGGKGTGYRVSAERVQAMKDAGIWEDPERRAKAIKRYRDYDQNASR